MGGSRIVNLNDSPTCECVYIGRGSPWGNPFRIGADGSRDCVISKYETWIRGRPELLARLPELKGATLACFCAPKKCHGSVLLKLMKEQGIE
jgi:hypothetical protein